MTGSRRSRSRHSRQPQECSGIIDEALAVAGRMGDMRSNADHRGERSPTADSESLKNWLLADLRHHTRHVLGHCAMNETFASAFLEASLAFTMAPLARVAPTN